MSDTSNPRSDRVSGFVLGACLFVMGFGTAMWLMFQSPWALNLGGCT